MLQSPPDTIIKIDFDAFDVAVSPNGHCSDTLEIRHNLISQPGERYTISFISNKPMERYTISCTGVELLVHVNKTTMYLYLYKYPLLSFKVYTLQKQIIHVSEVERIYFLLLSFLVFYMYYMTSLLPRCHTYRTT